MSQGKYWYLTSASYWVHQSMYMSDKREEIKFEHTKGQQEYVIECRWKINTRLNL